MNADDAGGGERRDFVGGVADLAENVGGLGADRLGGKADAGPLAVVFSRVAEQRDRRAFGVLDVEERSVVADLWVGQDGVVVIDAGVPEFLAFELGFQARRS